jgi:hypothetical protein
MVRDSIFLTLLLVCSTGGCTTPRDWTKIGNPNDYPFSNKAENVVVAVDPWTRSEDLNELFKKQPGREVLALRLTIFNQGKDVIRFSSTQAEVLLPGGACVRPMTLGEMSRILETHETAVAHIITIGTLGYGGLLAGAISEGNTENNWKSQRAVRTCAMTLAKVDPGQALTGFLFFKHPQSRGSWKDTGPSEFRIRRVPKGGNGDSLKFAVKLSDSKPERDL